MIFSRRALSLSSLGTVLAGAVLVACADGGRLVGPPEPEKPAVPDTSLFAMQCEINLQTKTLGCGQPGAGGDSRKLILGGQNVFVTLAADNFATTLSGDPAVADTLAMDVTVRNLIPQALGVLTDGTPDVANGVRVFFYTGPFAVPTGVASVEDEDGTDTFLASLEPFYRYPQVIRPMETSAPRRWKLAYTPGATSVRFSVYVDAQVQYPDGWVRITPETDTLQLGETVTLSGTAVDEVGRSAGLDQTLAWSSSNPDSVSVDAATGLVTALGRGSVTITATNGELSGTARIVVNNAPMAVADTIDALGNLTVPVDSAQGLLANDTDANGDGLVVVAGTFPTDRGGSVTLDADGSLQYLGPAGFEMGYDSVQYTVTDGVQSARAYLHINVGARVWYVQPGAAAAGDGTDARPFDALAGVDSIADADETVYVLAGGSTPVADEGITLKAGQSLVGQALVAPVTTTLNERAVVLLATGDAALLRRTTAGNTVRLGTDNTISGLLVGSTAGAAISGSGFGTLSVDSVSLDATGGPALDLETGTLAVSLDSLASAGSATDGVRLVGTGGTLTATTGTVAGTFTVTGGSVAVTYPGSLSETDAALVSVSGTHTGTLVFSGGLAASGGTGLQFNDADGTYTFSGTTALNGGDAGIDVVGGSAGTFSFGASTTITNPSGDAVVVNGSAPTLTYAGSISSNAGRPVLVDALSGGTVEFSGAIGATGLGILVQNNTAGAVRFTGSSKSLSTGTNPAVVLANNGAASTLFAGGGLEITTTTGAGFAATGGGLVQVTGLGNRIVTTTGTPVTISGTTIDGSGVTFAQVSADGAANGIVLSNTGATNGFQVVGDGSATAGSGGVIQNTTGVAVSLTSTDSTVLRYLTLAGAGGIEGTSFGALTVDNVAVTSVGAPALSLATGEVTGTFSSVTASGATNAVNLSAVNGFFAANGGTLTGGAGAAFNLSGGDVGVVWNGSISQANAAPLVSIGGGHNVGTLTFQTGTLSATNGSGLRFANADGNYSFNGSTVLNGGTAGVDISGGSAGVFTFGTGTSINSTAAADTAFFVGASNPGVTYSGSISKASTGPLVQMTDVSGGSVTFNTGTLSATAGTGLQFSNADGTVAFNGATTLGGGDAGVDILAGSDGSFTFGSSVGITSPTGPAIVLSSGSAAVSFSGNVTQATAGQALLSVNGGHTGAVNFPNGTLTATNGTGLQFDNADGTYTFAGTVNLANSVGGADAAIDVTNNSAGAFSFNANTDVTNPANQLFVISNSAPTFTYAGSFTKNNNAATGILAQSNTGGTISFTGDRTTESKVLSTGTATAVSLVNNGSASFQFSGGGLAITTTSGNGFNATGGGTVQVTGAVNTIVSGTGTAVNVQNTTIGGSGMSFQSVSSSGGANGIVLVNTGVTNGLQVTGTGTAGSGGSITNTVGGDGAVAGNAVYLNNARNVSLNWMGFSGHANNGLFGIGVRGLSMNKVRFTGNHGTSNSGTYDESAVNLVDVGGPVKITNSRLDGGAYNGINFENISGTAPALDSLVLENDTIEFMQGSTTDSRNSAVRVNLSDGTADVRIRNNWVTYWWANAIHVLMTGTASGTARIINNFADNTNGALAGAGGIWVAGCNMAFNISGNTVRHTNGTAISADKANCDGTTFQGTINGNAIGVSGDPNSGSFTGIGIFASGRNGTTTVNITNNILRQINGSANGAITTQAGDNVAFPPSGTLNATISGNNIQEAGTTVNNAQHGILVTHGTTSSGANDTHLGCYNVLNNTIINFVSGTANNRIRVNQRFGTTSRWPGYTGAATGSTSGPDMAAYLLAHNTASTSTNANSSTGGFLNTSPAGSSCPQPSL